MHEVDNAVRLLLEHDYAAFNARDIEAVLAALQRDIRLTNRAGLSCSFIRLCGIGEVRCSSINSYNMLT